MPIPIQQLQASGKPLEDRILEFLAKNKSSAYAFYELVAGVEGFTDLSLAALTALGTPEEVKRLLDPYQKALTELAEGRKIQLGEVRGVRYVGLVEGS